MTETFVQHSFQTQIGAKNKTQQRSHCGKKLPQNIYEFITNHIQQHQQLLTYPKKCWTGFRQHQHRTTLIYQRERMFLQT